ncbi:MAG: diaminopimelate decarboxylase [Chloroflexi bacterium]|nr:diaminopimelate decarboxylase [Chloroflexota bacterium]
MEEAVLGLFPVTAEVKDNHLFIGGCDSLALAQEFGTPLYVFDEETLRRSCREFRQEFSSRYPETQVIYACKALLLRPLVRLLMEEGLGLDVVSGGELAVARAGGFPLERVYFHGNNKSPQELALALGAGVGRVVVDNFYELGLLEAEAKKGGRQQDIMLRLCPGVDPHTHAHTTTGAVDSKFGFAMEQGEKAVAQAMASQHLRLLGLHFHLGSPIFEVEPYREAIRLVLGFAADMAEKFGFHLQEFSPGGGFAIAYTRERPAPPVAYYAEGIAQALLEGLEKHGLPRPRLILEPGRALVGRAAVALYRAGSRKDIPGVRTYVSLDGGMGDNIRPALYGARYEALVANRAGEQPTERVTLAGRFCESGDVLIKDIFLPRVFPGDIVAVPAMGAYSIPMASNYNAAPRPAIVLVKKGRAELWRRRESYQDLMAMDVD